jgi:hypothetical protein
MNDTRGSVRLDERATSQDRRHERSVGVTPAVQRVHDCPDIERDGTISHRCTA